MRRRSGLGHPAALAAIALLLVNDHLLKDSVPGWLTGKLSDVAGLVFFPLLVWAVVQRSIALCVIGSGAAFAAVKLWQPANTGGEWLLGAARWPLDALADLSLPSLAPVEIVRDPTDLLALPALAIAWWIHESEV